MNPGTPGNEPSLSTIEQTLYTKQKTLAEDDEFTLADFLSLFNQSQKL